MKSFYPSHHGVDGPARKVDKPTVTKQFRKSIICVMHKMLWKQSSLHQWGLEREDNRRHVRES